MTTLARGELVTAIELPLPATPHAARPTSGGRGGAATTSPRSRWRARSTTTGSTRLAYGSVGPRPVLVVDETGILADPAAADDGQDGASSSALLAGASPSPRSMRASPEYRLAMLRVLGAARGRDRASTAWPKGEGDR